MSHTDALDAARDWMLRSYNSSTWEHLVVGTTRAASRARCLTTLLGIEVPHPRRSEVGGIGAAALRRRFPELTDSPAAWRAKAWSAAEIEEVVAIVKTAVERALATAPSVLSTAPTSAAAPCDTSPGPHGFAPWQRFATRRGVPDEEGVYLIGLGNAHEGTPADPFAEHVMYIGMTERRGLRVRLDEFETAARSCSGHTGGWHYRTEIYPDDWASLSTFRDTVVSWRESPGDAPTLEANLRRGFATRFGRLPRLNRV